MSKFSLQRTWPWPGVLRSFSVMWTWQSMSAQAAIASGIDLLFDVGVERVVHHAAAGMVDLAAEAGCVGGVVEEIRFKAVEVLDAERDAELAGVLGDVPHALDAPLPFVFVGPAPVKWPMAEWYGPTSVVQPAASQQSSACLCLRCPWRGCSASGLIGLSSSVRIVTAVRSRPRSSSRLAPLGVVEVVFEDRQLDAVVAHFLELLEDRQHASRSVRRSRAAGSCRISRFISPEFKVRCSRFQVVVQGPRSKVQSQAGAAVVSRSGIRCRTRERMWGNRSRTEGPICGRPTRHMTWFRRISRRASS